MKFALGEIAIYCNGDFHAQYNGSECTVDSLLGWRFPKSAITGQVMRVYGYRTIAADGKIFTVRPEQLRKRRPPQDWFSLCDLRETAPERELETA